MKKDYDKNYYVVKADEIEKNFDADGVAKTELLPGVYDGGIRSFKYFLKAGSSVSLTTSNSSSVTGTNTAPFGTSSFTAPSNLKP